MLICLNFFGLVSFFVLSNDISGGVGVNFFVEWLVDLNVFSLLIEVIMVMGFGMFGLLFMFCGCVISWILFD